MHAPSGTHDASDPHHWIARRWFTASGALVAELPADAEPFAIFERLSRQRHCVFLDSAVLDGASRAAHGADRASTEGPVTPRLGRFSYIAADPIHSLHVEAANDGLAAERVNEAFALLRSLLADLSCATIPGLPPFQGGVAGLVSYDCGLARLGLESAGSSDVPLLSLHIYDLVFAFDHDARDRGAAAQRREGRPLHPGPAHVAPAAPAPRSGPPGRGTAAAAASPARGKDTPPPPLLVRPFPDGRQRGPPSCARPTPHGERGAHQSPRGRASTACPTKPA